MQVNGDTENEVEQDYNLERRARCCLHMERHPSGESETDQIQNVTEQPILTACGCPLPYTRTSDGQPLEELELRFLIDLKERFPDQHEVVTFPFLEMTKTVRRLRVRSECLGIRHALMWARWTFTNEVQDLFHYQDKEDFYKLAGDFVSSSIHRDGELWHHPYSEDQREYIVQKLVHANFPVSDPQTLNEKKKLKRLIRNAQNAEKKVHKTARRGDQYYELLAKTIYELMKENRTIIKGQNSL